MPAAMRAFFGPIGFRAGNARLGASVKWRLAFSKASASMGFRRADWLKRGAKRTLVRERCTKAKMLHKTQRSVGCVRRSEDRRQKSPASANAEPGSARSGAEVGEVNCHWQKGPASACAEPGSARSGAEVGEIKCHWHFIYGRSGAFRISVRSTR